MSRRLTPEQDLERLLDEDGGEFGAIYRRLSRPEPPRRLDRSVLAHAARAVHGGRAPRAQRWALAMGSVTGVVLAAGIAWQVGQHMQDQESVPEGSRTMQDSRVVPVEAITEPRVRRAAKKDLIMRDSEPAIELREEASIPAAPPTPAQPPPMSPPAARSQPAAAPRSNQPASGADASGSSGALGKSVMQEANPAPRPQAVPEAFPTTAEAVSSDSAIRATPERAAADMPATAAGKRSAAQPSIEAEASAASAPVPDAAVTADDSLDRNMRLEPEAWLREIERLAETGQRPLAIRNLRLFRTRYPDWPLPPGLRMLEQ